MNIHGQNAQSAERALRISPVILRSEPEVLLSRRQRLFSEMTTSLINRVENGFVVQIDTTTIIPANTSREARTIYAKFDFASISTTTAAFTAFMDGDTYAHSIGKLETSCYPLALRPYVPVEDVALEVLRLSEEVDAQLEVVHMRATSTRDGTKMQLHGQMSVDQVLSRVRQEQSVLQGIRLRGVLKTGQEVFRMRTDSRCRLLIEKWELPFHPFVLTQRLLNRSIEFENRRRVASIPTNSEASRVYTAEYRLSDQSNAMDLLYQRLKLEKGLFCFKLDGSHGNQCQVIDFISNYECIFTTLNSTGLAITSTGAPPEAFVTRLKAIITQIETQAGK